MKYYVFAAINKSNPDDQTIYIYNAAVDSQTSIEEVMRIFTKFIKKEFSKDNKNIKDYTFRRTIEEYRVIKAQKWFNGCIYIEPEKVDNKNPFKKKTHHDATYEAAKEEIASMYNKKKNK